MTVFRAAFVRLSIALCLLFPVQLLAESAAEIQSKITQSETDLSSKKSALETVLNRLSSYQFKIQDAKERLESVRKDLREAETNLINADADTSKEGPRLRDIAARRLELAKHNVESHEARLDRVARKSDELQAEADQLGSEIERTETNLTKLTEKLRNTIAADKAAAQAEQARLREAIERARAEQHSAQEEAKQEAQRLAQEAEAKRMAKQQADEELKQQDNARLATQQAIETKAAVKLDGDSSPASAGTEQTSDQTSETALTPLQRYARNEMSKLNNRIKNSNKSEERHFLELLMEVDRDQVFELEYLGNNQFYTELKLDKGKHKLTINLRRFIATVPDEADGDTFVVIYDASNRDDGRFIIFNKNLL